MKFSYILKQIGKEPALGHTSRDRQFQERNFAMIWAAEYPNVPSSYAHPAKPGGVRCQSPHGAESLRPSILDGDDTTSCTGNEVGTEEAKAYRPSCVIALPESDLLAEQYPVRSASQFSFRHLCCHGLGFAHPYYHGTPESLPPGHGQPKTSPCSQEDRWLPARIAMLS